LGFAGGGGRLAAAALIALAAPAMARGQGVAADLRDSSGVLSGVLAGLDDGQPIAYATVGVVGSGRTSFADGKGSFRLSRLVPGLYLLRVRQIGYAPLDTNIAVAPGPEETTVTLRLRRIALRLARVGIEGHHSKGCVATGVPDSAVNATLATVFSQVRENVDRFRLLLDEYPFLYSREERRMMRRDPGDDSTESVDTASYESRSRRPYQTGGIIYFEYDALGRSTRFMYLPTFRDLADPAFLSAHCFAYRGTERLGGPRGTEVMRVDFRPASAISAPDVEGSIYLDAQRFVVRRAVFRMTRPQAADPPLIGLSVTTTFRELVPLVPVFDSVEVEQPLPPRRNDKRGSGFAGAGEMIKVSSFEADRLLTFAFERRAPGEQGPASPSKDSTPKMASTVVTGTSNASTPVVMLAGRVIAPDGTPVVGATVGLFGAGDTARTSDSGAFAFGEAPPGAHMLWVRRLGFQPAHVPVTISRDHSRTITVTLVRSVPVLPTVTTTAQARSAMKEVGLDRRMRAGIGQFLTYDQIQKRQVTNLSELLQGMRGIRLTLHPLEFETSVVGTRGVGDCVAFEVDGIPQSLVTDHDVDLLADPSTLGAIEVYSSSERPSEFGGQEERPQIDPRAPPAPVYVLPKCHLVVIWTRARLGLPAADKGTVASELARTSGRAVFPNIAACEPRPADDTIDVAMYATLQSERTHSGPDTAWSSYVDRILAGLRRAFIMPSDLPLPVFGYPFRERTLVPGKAPSPAAGPVLSVAPALSNVVVFMLDSTGTVSGARVGASSLSGPADTTILAAITDAGASHAFPDAPPSLRREGPIRFDLIVSTARPAMGDRAVVLGRVSVPSWTLRRRASLAEGPQPELGPDRTATASMRDSASATLEFVVDEQGRVAMPTVRAIATAGATNSEFDRTFVTRLTRALPGFHFEPALIGACPVRQIMTQTFSYDQH